MTYYKLIYYAAFLPAAMLLYQLMPRKIRWSVLMVFSLVFFCLFSKGLVIYLVAAAIISYTAGMLLDRQNRQLKLKINELQESCEDKTQLKELKQALKNRSHSICRFIVAAGIMCILSMLLYLKYYNFFITNINRFMSTLGSEKVLGLRVLVLPIGISFYSLQAIGYMADVFWKKIEAQRNPLKLLMFLSFFPTLVEGPISAYADIKDELYKGDDIDPDNVVKGYIRIFWGVMKKLVIADRLNVAVAFLFNADSDIHGAYVAAAAILFTIQEYMDFSGCMDMVLGSAQLFGIKLPENFRQPFFAANASEFWRRWHISLGVWFKTYIFYPVSMGENAKRWNRFGKKYLGKHMTRIGASALALLPVWLCNGLWHGPKWTYIFYGIFYFFVILLEIILEPLGDRILDMLKLKKEQNGVHVIRVLKTWIIIFTGELLFRADSLSAGFRMLKNMFTDFSLNIISEGGYLGWGMDRADWVVVIVMLIAVIVVGVIKEKGVNVTAALLEKPMLVRWALTLILIMSVLIFGLYGPGYEEVDLIYAGF